MVKQEQDEKPSSPEQKETQSIPASFKTSPLKDPPTPDDELNSVCHTPDSSPAAAGPAAASASSPTHSTSKPTMLCSTPADSTPFSQFPAQFGLPLALQHQQLLGNDQLLRVLTERSGHWFSLVPRSPCDDSSLTQPLTPTRSSPQPNNAAHTQGAGSPPPKSCSPHQHLQPTSTSSSPLNTVHDGLGNHTVFPLQVRTPSHWASELAIDNQFSVWYAAMVTT